jgi:hypothetical protein
MSAAERKLRAMAAHIVDDNERIKQSHREDQQQLGCSQPHGFSFPCGEKV